MSKYHCIIIARILFVLVIMLGLGACASNSLRKSEFAPPIYEVSPPPLPSNGSIYSSKYKMSLFSDIKAKQVGDLLTIILVEETTASKSADISADKNSSVNVLNPTILGRAVSFGSRTLETAIEGSNQFDGAGSANQSNSLDGSVSVIVEQVLSSGNLRVRGQKLISINQGDEFVRVTGLVRPEDIRGDNTVLSTQIADAHFSYGGRGVVADSNSMGWLARFFNSPYWPL
ncbi:flagellar basal body L-ring protein FlgH [bacterium AH-315-E07]|nr:flagellar basal body L-ring protein FlgH [bacterium AH-315-E07]